MANNLVKILFRGLVFEPKNKEVFNNFNWKNFKENEDVFKEETFPEYTVTFKELLYCTVWLDFTPNTVNDAKVFLNNCSLVSLV